MAPSFKLLLVVTLFAYSISKIASISPKGATTISAKLIHPNSKHSPCRNKTGASAFNWGHRPWWNNLARHNVIHDNNESYARAYTTDIEASLVSGEVFPLPLVVFHVGHQEDPQYAVMDTGSGLLWVQCDPCPSCAITHSKMYNPTMSPTYKGLQCMTELCSQGHGECDQNLRCMFQQHYSGGTESYGYLATETISFEDNEENLHDVSGVVFGCSHNNTNHPDKLMTGVFGLGYHNLSIAVRFGKFSYCVGKIVDPDHEYNYLILGDGAELLGDSTSIGFDSVFYYVTLEGISLNEAMLDIPPSTFSFKKGTSRSFAEGVFLDSGDPLTRLTRVAHQAVIRAVLDLLMPFHDHLWIENHWGYVMCTNGDAETDTRGFPALRFHFAEGAELTMESSSLFFQTNETTFCFGIATSPGAYSIIGMNAQQFHNIGYDISNKKMYIQRMECDTLQD